MFKKILIIVVFPVLLFITSGCAPANSYGYDEEQADGGNSPEQEVIAEEETWYAIPANCEGEPVPADKNLILYYDWCTLEEPQGIEYFELTDHAIYVDEVEVPILAQDLGEAYFNEEEECFSQGYWMDIGYLEPGYHIIVTNATPREQVFDGLDWFGPGTEYEHLDFWCNVVVGDENVQVAAQVKDEGDSVEEELSSEEAAPVEEEEHICNRSKYVRETIPDHTVFTPGQTFEKTWTVRNEGECTWNTGYTFDHTQGATLGGQTSQNLVQDVAPGEEITLKVNLKAPDAPGTYTGRWEIFADNGEVLGWYSVVIDVIDDSVPEIFSVTSVNLFLDYITEPCCVRACADISASGTGTVTYIWEEIFANGGMPSFYPMKESGSIYFDTASTKTVCSTFYSPDSTEEFTNDVSFYVDNPNHQNFGTIRIP